MNSQVDYFVREAIRHGRALPMKDSVRFFAGLLQLAGDQPEVASVRNAFTLLQESDRQLELLGMTEDQPRTSRTA
jgi:hypothetical protein